MRRGITLIEVLVVIAICIMIAGISVLFIARHRENAFRAECHNNLGKIGFAVRSYHTNSSADKGHQYLPPARIADGYAAWPVLLAPLLSKEHPLHNWDLEAQYTAQANEIREACLATLLCPARTRADARSQAGDVDAAGKFFSGGLGDYGSVAGDGTAENGALVSAEVLERNGDRILKWRSRTGLASITRGESHTIIIGEKHVLRDHTGDAKFGDGSLYNGGNPGGFSRAAGPGFRLAQTIDDPYNNQFGSWHQGICHFLYADASARAFAIATLGEVLGQISQREK